MVIPFNEHERIQANISDKSMNRLSIDGDRIQEVIGLHDGIAVEKDKQHNNLFLKVPQGNQEQIELTIITEGGLVQDLTLTPVNQSSASIVLKTTKKEPKPFHSHNADHVVVAPNTHLSNTSHQNVIIDLMKILFTGHFEPGSYSSRDRSSKIAACAEFSRGFSHGGLIAEIYEVSNHSEEPLYLNESDFYQLGDFALSVDKKALEKGETAKLYVIRKDV
jgi:type-F conjugative transfer system secretin TraK